jgi:hypothetical protein
MNESKIHYQEAWPPILHAAALWLNAEGFENAAKEVENISKGTELFSVLNNSPWRSSKDRFTSHNVCLKLSHATCLQLELYCVNQAHNSPF